MRFFALFVLLAVSNAVISANAQSPTVSENYALTPDGVKIFYRVVGAGPEIVIVPFAMYDGSAFDSLAVGRRIVTYDPRGRGRSDAVPPEKISLDYLLVDLETVRKAVGAEKIAIIGWSGSGMETFVYALRNPGRVARLVQLAPVPPRIDPYGQMMFEDRQRRTDPAAKADYDKRVAASAFKDDPKAGCMAYQAVSIPPLLADPSNVSMIPNVCEFPNEYPEELAGYFQKLFESLVGYDWRDSLSIVAIPRLVIYGAKDNIPFEGVREWVAGQSTARLLVIENAGHFPHYEQPEPTLRAIDEFLKGEWPERAVAIP